MQTTRPLRWLTLADTPPNPDSGASGTDVQTVRALRELGHEVDDVWNDSLPHRWKHGNLHYALELPRAYRRVVKQRLTAGTYDVVLASQPHAYLAARWVRQHAPQTLFLSRSHGWEAHVETALAPHRKRLAVPRWKFPRGLLGRPLAARLLKHCQWLADSAHAIVVSAGGCRDFILRHHGVTPSRVAVIPQAVPPTYVTPDPPPHKHRTPGSVLLVCTASFVKGIDDALAIIQASHENKTGLRFTWVVESGTHTSISERLGASRAGVLKLLPPMSQAALRDVYDSHRMFLFPSLFEGFGKACLEAMSRAVVVVASDVGVARDLIIEGKTGYRASPGDRVAMLKALVAVNHDEQHAAQVGSAARVDALRNTWKDVTGQLVTLALRLREEFGVGQLP